MEHRWSTRRPVEFDVTIHQTGFSAVPARALNIGLEGMFLKTGRAVCPRNTPLEVEFKLDSRPDAESFRVPALVIHNTCGGMGVMFRLSSRELRTHLRMLLNAQNGALPAVAATSA